MAAARDPFLDGLRSVSIVRVVMLHLLQRVEHPFAAVFSFFMPGMPLLFFVSGALAAQSLADDGPERRRKFWRERARRLFVPFWAFGLVVLTVCAIGALAWPDAAHRFPFASLWRWVLPLAGPQASPAYEKLNWHLWFLSSLILMLATAPWTTRIHRRWPGALALAFFAVGATIEIARIGVPDLVRNTLLFGAAFQAGYFFTDGRVRTVPRAGWIAIAIVLAACSGLFYAARAPGAMLHAVLLALVLLGLGFIALWMAWREAATRVFRTPRASAWIRRINARAYTIFLWGPVANDVAGRIVEPSSASSYAVDFALALTILFVLVRVFGPVEDWAARRTRKPAAVVPIDTGRGRAAA